MSRKLVMLASLIVLPAFLAGCPDQDDSIGDDVEEGVEEVEDEVDDAVDG